MFGQKLRSMYGRFTQEGGTASIHACADGYTNAVNCSLGMQTGYGEHFVRVWFVNYSLGMQTGYGEHFVRVWFALAEPTGSVN